MLVLDEPTTLLDLRNARDVMPTGWPACASRSSLVTHDLSALDGFERVLIFDDGRLVADAAPDAAVEHYRRLMRAGG